MMKHWEIIADNLSKAGWSRAVSQRWIAKANDLILVIRDNGKRCVVNAEEKLRLRFLELESGLCFRELV